MAFRKGEILIYNKFQWLKFEDEDFCNLYRKVQKRGMIINVLDLFRHHPGNDVKLSENAGRVSLK